MASEITTFTNERIRVAADLLAQLDNFGVSVINEWNARPDVKPPNDTTPIEGNDGGDGRSALVGSDAHNIINRLTDYKAAMDVSGVRNTVLQVAVRTTR